MQRNQGEWQDLYLENQITQSEGNRTFQGGERRWRGCTGSGGSGRGFRGNQDGRGTCGNLLHTFLRGHSLNSEIRGMVKEKLKLTDHLHAAK